MTASPRSAPSALPAARPQVRHHTAPSLYLSTKLDTPCLHRSSNRLRFLPIHASCRPISPPRTRARHRAQTGRHTITHARLSSQAPRKRLVERSACVGWLPLSLLRLKALAFGSRHMRTHLHDIKNAIDRTPQARTHCHRLSAREHHTPWSHSCPRATVPHDAST